MRICLFGEQKCLFRTVVPVLTELMCLLGDNPFQLNGCVCSANGCDCSERLCPYQPNGCVWSERLRLFQLNRCACSEWSRLFQSNRCVYCFHFWSGRGLRMRTRSCSTKSSCPVPMGEMVLYEPFHWAIDISKPFRQNSCDRSDRSAVTSPGRLR